MAALAATGISNPGQALSAGDREALFMKVFTGEVLTAFARTSVMMSRHQVRTISHGSVLLCLKFFNFWKAKG